MTQSSTTPEGVRIEHYQPTFEFTPGRVDQWSDGCVARSHFWNAISSLLPNMEAFCVKAISDQLNRIDDPKLRQEAIQFCRQESEHAGHHNRFNDLLQAQYPALARIERWERRWLSGLARLLSPKQFIAVFVFFEHMTSVIGHRGLENPENWFSGADTPLFDLWQWHALEEVAHKAVCFDCHRALGGGYGSRLMGFLISFFLILIPGLLSRLLYLSCKSRQALRWRYWSQLSRHLFGRVGVVRLITLDVLKFFRRAYQPWEMDSRPLLARYIEARPQKAQT